MNRIKSNKQGHRNIENELAYLIYLAILEPFEQQLRKVRQIEYFESLYNIFANKHLKKRDAKTDSANYHHLTLFRCGTRSCFYPPHWPWCFSRCSCKAAPSSFLLTVSTLRSLVIRYSQSYYIKRDVFNFFKIKIVNTIIQFYK